MISSWIFAAGCPQLSSLALVAFQFSMYLGYRAEWRGQRFPILFRKRFLFGGPFHTQGQGRDKSRKQPRF